MYHIFIYIFNDVHKSVKPVIFFWFELMWYTSLGRTVVAIYSLWIYISFYPWWTFHFMSLHMQIVSLYSRNIWTLTLCILCDRTSRGQWEVVKIVVLSCYLRTGSYVAHKPLVLYCSTLWMVVNNLFLCQETWRTLCRVIVAVLCISLCICTSS